MIKKILLILSLAVGSVCTAFAGVDCLPPGCIPNAIPHEYPTHHVVSYSHGVLTAKILPGSIMANVERIASEQGWPQVVWNVPYDYKWIGETQIHAGSLTGLLSQLLRNYPLQAVLYHGNHILAIYPRVLK